MSKIQLSTISGAREQKASKLHHTIRGQMLIQNISFFILTLFLQ